MFPQWLKHCASHHSHSVACNVLAVEKNVYLSCCHISGCHRCLHSARHNSTETYFRRYALIMDEWLQYAKLIGYIPEELILSGTYQCIVVFEEGVTLQIAIIWMITTAWETLALCIAVCIAVKHFREVWQTSSGGIIGDCFTVLMETHLIYFARWARGFFVVVFLTEAC
jgi:hypothetical protein